MPEIVTDPMIFPPPVVEAGEAVNVVRLGATTSKLADALEPFSEAVKEPVALVATGTVVTVTDAKLTPAFR